MFRLPLILGFAVTLLSSCVSDEPGPPPPPPPEGPDIGSARSVHVELVTEHAVDFVTGDDNLGIFFEVSEELFLLDPLVPEPLSLGGDAGTIGGLAHLSGGELLVSGSQGLFVVGEDGMEVSPLNELLPELGPAGLHSMPGDDLWIVGEDGLLLWREGSVYDVQPSGLPIAGSEVVWGELDGAQALWVGAGDAIYALVEDSSGFSAHPRAGDFAVTGLAVDSYGTLWAASDGGLWGRWPDGVEEVLDLPFATLDAAASGRSGELWLMTDQGLWLHETGTFRPIDNAPSGDLVAVDSVGRALIAGDEGLVRLSSGRPLLFLGVADGSELEDVETVHLLPTVTDSFTGLSATLDGTPVLLDESDGFSLLLDSELLSDGAHELHATAIYGEDDEVTASLYFSVGEFIPPTWSADIEPLFVRECALCHSATAGATSAGGGHPMDSLAAWQTEIEEVLDAVINDRMPLNSDPLDEATISLIEDWRAGGFLE